MPLSRWFYWLFSCSLLVLLVLLGYGGVVMYKSEYKKVKEDINNITERTADTVREHNFTLNHLSKAISDPDYNLKLAFASGMTRTRGRMALNFQLTLLRPVPDILKGDPSDTTVKTNADSKDALAAKTGDGKDSLKLEDDHLSKKNTADTGLFITKKWLDSSNIKFNPKAIKTIFYFDTLFRIQLKTEHLTVPYRIEKLANYRPDPVPHSSGLFIIDYYDPVVYRIVYQLPRSLVAKRLVPYASVALLLLVLVSGAFLLYHKSYKLQVQMSQFKESLFSNVTHELKTPLSSLQLIVSSFKNQDQGLSLKQMEYIDFADKELQRMNLLIEKILSFGKLNEEQFALNKEIVSLAELIDEAIQIMNIKAGSKSADITFERMADTAIIGDRILLLNMLVSIIDNAVKYTAGSPVIGIWLKKNKHEIQISIHDNGPGISPKFQKKIFEPFFRVPTGNEHSVKGHGLGLSFAQQVAALHSGKITVTSEPGAGSTFIITLPS